MNRHWKILVHKLRDRLRRWLLLDQEITPEMYWKLQSDVTRLQGDTYSGPLGQWFIKADDKFQTMELAQEALNERDDKLEALLRESAQNLQGQIDELSRHPVAPVLDKEEKADSEQVTNGFVPRSVRKARYEAAHRRPAETGAERDIRENTRLIASGVRKPEEIKA